MAKFYMPVEVYEEPNAVMNHAADLKAFGEKALIVTGRHSAAANGSLADVTAALDSAGVAWCHFNEVEENPSVDTVMKARELGQAEGADFVIGVGGGSPMDAAKAIALLLAHPERGSELLYEAGDSAALPIVAVPTTCGTGSEVTPVSVLTNRETGVKKAIPHQLFPDLALIDGKYLASAPLKVLANTAFDALTHLFESYLNVTATPYSRMCVEAGLKTWALSQPVIRGEKAPEEEDLLNMMRASTYGGMAIAQTSTVLPHGLSYALTTRLHVPHGKATAYFTAGYLTEAPAADRDYLLKTAGFKDLEDFRAVYHGACGEVEADPETLREALAIAVSEVMAGGKTKLSPMPADEAMLQRIACYELEH